MKTAGIILLVLGIIGTFVFGMQAINNSESFSFKSLLGYLNLNKVSKNG